METVVVDHARRTAQSEVCLRNRLGINWQAVVAPDVLAWARGSAFHRDALLDAPALADAFAACVAAVPLSEQPRCLEELLRTLNGYFAIILQADWGVFAAVDRLRSLPLFYGQRDGMLYLSDGAEWVRQRVGDTTPEPLSLEEFQLTGYVTGADTLYPNVKQLQAGEVLLYAGKSGQRLTLERYYRFLHAEPSEPVAEGPLLSALDAASEAAIRRLVRYASGRQIVVPLSGGLDSRAIVTLLRRLDYRNVLTFSYGVPGNRESRTSQAVAKSLGYPWTFVQYRSDLWRHWWSSEQRAAYQRYASGWASLPHLQDWPAVWVLREQARLACDAVFAPGHTAMLAIQANKVDALARQTCLRGMELLRAALTADHYSLHSCDDELLSRVFGHRLASALGDLSLDSPEQVANALDMWAWQERQAKFIINSVRVYEYWGCDWWLPWWDAEFMAFWEGVPFRWRVGKRLYDRYVNQAFAAAAGVPAGEWRPAKDSWRNRWRGLSVRLAYLLPRSMLAKAAGIVAAERYSRHPLAIYGRYPAQLPRRLMRQGYTINGVGAYTFVKEFVCPR